MVIARYTLPQNNDNLPLPFFGGNYPIVLRNNIYSYLFMIQYVVQEIGGNNNSPYFLNVMVNYHYQGKNRVITR